MTEPIKRKDIANCKTASLPDEVIDAFNELIANNWDGSMSVVRQDDAVKLCKEKLGEKPFQNHMLNIEAVYRSRGWQVTYDKPGYNESYPATFEFR